MALKKLNWLKYLFVNRGEAETEQDYWNEKRKKHLAREHSEGVVAGLEVTETDPPSLSVKVAAGRALDAAGDDPEVESPQNIDCSGLVPGSSEVTVYIVLRYNTVETDPYFVDEIGDYQNKYTQDSFILEATTQAPSSPQVELARFRLGAGATEIRDAADPDNPGLNEIDLRSVKHSGKEVVALHDLSDVSPNEADAFNNMNSPSASNPIATAADVENAVAPVRNEVETARGSKPSIDARLDVMLNNDGSFKGITQISPAVPLVGGGTEGDVGIGITDATPFSRGAMSAADKAKLIPMDVAKRFVFEHHYAKITPSTTKAAYGLVIDNVLVGVSIWGYGVRPKHTIQKWLPGVDVLEYLELNRLCLLDEMARNSESRFLSIVVERIKKDFPDVKVLLSWADGLRGKPGYVYQACSWLYGGFINSEFYTTEDGRVIHPRLLITRYGTRGKAIQKKLGLIHYFGKQFMYAKFLCSHRERKRILKNSPVKWTGKYPKIEDITFELSERGGPRRKIDYVPQFVGREYEIELSNRKGECNETAS